MGLAVSAILFFKEKAARNRADEQAAIAQAVTDFLQNDLLSQAKTSTQAQEGIAVDPNMTVRQAVDRASARLEGRFTKQPLVEASIRMTLADIYDEMDEHGSSQPHAQRALELTERILGPRDPSTIAARMHLTDPNPTKNVALLEKTLDLAKAVLGREDRKTLDCMNNLGVAYWTAGQFDKAISLLEETVKLDKAKFGPEDGSSLWAQHDLGLVYESAGRSTDAVPLLEGTFGLLKKKWGPDHPLALADMAELANAYQNAGRVNDAVALLEEALKLFKAKVGPGNAQTLAVMGNLALAYKAAGKLSNALPLFEEKFNIRMTKLGIGNQDTLLSLHTLAVTYQEAGRSADADRVFSDVLTPAFMSQSNSSIVLRICGNFYARYGRWEEAAADFTRIIELKSDDTLDWHKLAGLLAQSGELDRYREHCRKMSEKFANSTDPTTDQRVAMDCLILPSSAVNLEISSRLADNSLNVGPDHSLWPYSTTTKALAEFRLGRFASAVDWSEKLLESTNSVPAFVQVANEAVLAMGYLQLKQEDKARATFVKGQDIADKQLPKLGSRNFETSWLDWIIAQALMNEARTLVEGLPETKSATK